MKTKILLMAMLVLSIAACGNGKGKDGDNDQEVKQKSEEVIRLEECYEANPNDTTALKALARAYASDGMIDEAVNLGIHYGSLVTNESGRVLGLYEQGIFLAELYRSVGDEESAQMALEDARIFLNRQTWGEPTEEKVALVNECLAKIDSVAAETVVNTPGD